MDTYIKVIIGLFVIAFCLSVVFAVIFAFPIYGAYMHYDAERVEKYVGIIFSPFKTACVLALVFGAGMFVGEVIKSIVR